MQAENLPDGWAVAGWDHGADWVNVEAGGPLPSDNDLVYSDMVVLSYTDKDREVSYFTVHSGFDEDYTIEDAIEDLESEYGIG
jgi:hypothetical protein